MNTSYLKNATGILLLILIFYSIAEAGPSASKVYRMAVTIPERAYIHQGQGASIGTDNKGVQTAIEREIRNKKMVTVKTVVMK